MTLAIVPITLFYFAVLRTVQGKCQTLVASPYMELSASQAYVGDPPVTVSCKAGFKLEGDELTNYLTCSEVSGIAVWNDTMGKCVLKSCQTYMAPTFVMSVSNVNGDVGDSITTTCMQGYAVSVDPTNRTVERTQVISCEEDPSNVTGQWSTAEPCLELNCFPPQDIQNTVQIYTNITIGSTVVYHCKSGFEISPNRYGVTAICNSSAMWHSDEIPYNFEKQDSLCYEIAQHIGCVPESELVTETIVTYPGDTPNIMALCRQQCEDTYNTVAAIRNDTCICGSVRRNHTRNHVCDVQCPDLNTTTMDTPVFCGGQPDLYSTFSTFDGCYGNIDLSSYPSEGVTYGNIKLTCRERCRVQMFSHAGLFNMTCICLNSTVTDASKQPLSSCDASTATYIFDLAKYSGSATSCKQLYYLGVMVHAEYQLHQPTRTQTCYFEDGTVCENGWVGYKHHCYMVQRSEFRDFQDARDFCLANNADLLSITTEDEQDFIEETMDMLADINYEDRTDPYNIWLGLVDSYRMSVLTWLDGNVMPYAIFAVGHPKVAVGEYAYLRTTKAESSKLIDLRRSVCKKTQEELDCVNITSLPPSIFTVSDVYMTLTLCSEVCKGQISATIAVVQNDTCNCLATMPPYTAVPKVSCSTPCPGNSYQFCGGDLDLHTVMNVTGRVQARSCSELQMVGIGNGTFLVGPDSSPTLQYCGHSTCPYSWVSIDDHCYKFTASAKNRDNAFLKCAGEDSYMVVLETTEEIDQMIAIIMNISVFRDVDDWILGLTSQSVNGGVFRWSNGRQVETSSWNATGATSGHTAVAMVMETGEWQPTKGEHSVVCEKAVTEYLGCFLRNSMTADVIIPDYSSMTIQQCVESCRGLDYSYGLLGHDYCTCSTLPPSSDDQMTGRCRQGCSGQSNQPCGGAGGFVSVYNISSYEPYMSCEDMFHAGIFLSMTYIVNGTSQRCDFLDGTVCEEGWVGHKNNCYRHFPKGSNSHFQTCKDTNASVTSLVNTAEYDFLVSYITRINFGEVYSRVFTGVSHVGYGFDVYINPDGSLAHNDLMTSDVIMAEDLHDSVGLVSFRMDRGLDLPDDGGVICKKEKDELGCFEKPFFLSPLLQNFGSMSLTLCKQLCIANGSDVALIGNDFCSCTGEGDMSAMNSSISSNCYVECPIKSNQYCGDGTVLWAYRTPRDEESLAGNCSDLYLSAVFYNTSYLIYQDTGVQVYRRCGFSDGTRCPATWLGLSNDCYKFVMHSDIVSSEYCSAKDSFLVNPTDPGLTNHLILTFTNLSLLFKNTYWQTGIWSVMYNVTYLRSDGRLVDPGSVQEIHNIPHGFVRLKVPSGKWSSVNSLKKINFVCQTNPDYLGCFTLPVNVTGASYSEFTSHSLSTCLQWCQGQHFLYAAVSVDRCQCLDDVTSLTSSRGQCLTMCQMVPSQSCGGVDVYTVVKISIKTGKVRTCRHLLTYGIIKPGWYSFNITDGSPRQVRCYNNTAPLGAIPSSAVVSPAVSSTQDGSSAGHLLFTFTSTVWHPAISNLDQWVKVKLDDDYIITGIFTTGLFANGESSYVDTYRIKYTDPVTSTWMWYSQNGDTDVSANCNLDTGIPLCYNYFWHPFVTDVIMIYPRHWDTRISLQLELLGQVFSQYNVKERFIGCCLDEDMMFTTLSDSETLDDCIVMCRTAELPFASLGYDGECGCGSGCPDNGFLDDYECPYNYTTWHRTGLGVARAIYTTYDTQCEDPSTLLENRTIAKTVFSYNHDVMTYGTTVHVECAAGWEPVDLNHPEDVIYCQQTTTWTNSTLKCQAVYCPVFAVVNGTINTGATHLAFNLTLTVTCNDTHYASNGDVNMTVTCQQNHTWTSIPTCSRENAKKVQKTYDLNSVTKVSDVTHMTSDISVRSHVDCATRCTADFDCVGANYQASVGDSGGTCRIYHEAASPGDLTTDPSWQYLAKRP